MPAASFPTKGILLVPIVIRLVRPLQVQSRDFFVERLGERIDAELSQRLLYFLELAEAFRHHKAVLLLRLP